MKIYYWLVLALGLAVVVLLLTGRVGIMFSWSSYDECDHCGFAVTCQYVGWWIKGTSIKQVVRSECMSI